MARFKTPHIMIILCLIAEMCISCSDSEETSSKIYVLEKQTIPATKTVVTVDYENRTYDTLTVTARAYPVIPQQLKKVVLSPGEIRSITVASFAESITVSAQNPLGVFYTKRKYSLYGEALYGEEKDFKNNYVQFIFRPLQEYEPKKACFPSPVSWKYPYSYNEHYYSNIKVEIERNRITVLIKDTNRSRKLRLRKETRETYGNVEVYGTQAQVRDMLRVLREFALAEDRSWMNISRDEILALEYELQRRRLI